MSEESPATGTSNSQPILQAMRDIALAKDALGILNALRLQILKSAKNVWILQSDFDLSGEAATTVAAAWPANPEAATSDFLNTIHKTARMQSVIISDVTDPGETSALTTYVSEAFAKGSLVIVPMIGRERTEGFILAHYTGKSDSEDIASTLSTCAEPAAVVFENARMMKRIQSALEETSTLYSTGLALSAAQSMQEIFEIALQEIAALSEGSRLELFVSGQGSTGEIDYVEQVGLWENGQVSTTASGPQQTVAAAPVLSQFPQTRANHYFDDMTDDARLDDAVRKSYRERGVRSLLMLPMASGSAWMGALLIESEKEAAFSEDQIRLCRNIIDQAAQSITSLHMLAQTQKTVLRDQLIDSMTVELQRSYSVDKVLETTVRALQPMLKNYDIQVRLSADAQDETRTAITTDDFEA